FAQPRRPGHAVVGVVGVELDAYTIPVERREVDVGISRTEAEDPRIEGKASPDVADDEVHAESDEGAAVRVRGHPRLARPLLGHAITVARACARRASVHAGTVTRTSATPAPRESEVPRPARAPPASAPAAAPASCAVWNAASTRGRSVADESRATASSATIAPFNPPKYAAAPA